jgi:hypothetical protein
MKMKQSKKRPPTAPARPKAAKPAKAKGRARPIGTKPKAKPEGMGKSKPMRKRTRGR